MEYEFRELCSKDIFPMLKILNKIGFKEFKDCFQSTEVKTAIAGAQDGNKDVTTVGMTVAFDMAEIILKNLPSCEEDIYAMLSSVSNAKKKDLETMPMAEFFEMIVGFVQKPEFKDFFKVVSKLFK